MDYLQKIILDFELQNVEGINECFRNGIHPIDYYNNQPLIYVLINFYPSGPQFKECIKAFVEYDLKTITGQTTTIKIPVNNIAAGIYMVRLIGNNTIALQKIFIQ